MLETSQLYLYIIWGFLKLGEPKLKAVKPMVLGYSHVTDFPISP